MLKTELPEGGYALHRVSLSDRPGVYCLTVRDGKIASIEKEPDPTGPHFYLCPPFADLHFHAGWTDFLHEEQQKRSRPDILRRIQNTQQILLKQGFRTLRDAGGFTDCTAPNAYPQILPCAAMLPTETLPDSLQPGQWVKIFATGGIGANPAAVLTPLLTEEQFSVLVCRIHEAGGRVMVHTWGGDSLTWAIRYGADSVEHAVTMSRQQAAQLAGSQIPVIVTARIYELIADNFFDLPAVFCERAARACESHAKSIALALKEGVRLGFGTDFFSDPDLAVHEAEEFDALLRLGIHEKTLRDTVLTVPYELLGKTTSFVPGNAADFLVFSENPFSAGQPSFLPLAHVLDGRFVSNSQKGADA